MLSTKMWQLITVSALLGIGSGLIVPLSTGLISRFFTGTYRTKQFGLSSAITNITLVLATVLTGYLAEVNWLFAVCRLPVSADLDVLSFYLKKNISPYPGIGINTTSRRTERPADSSFGKFGIQIPHLMQIMSFYGLATYLVIIISFNLPS